MQNDVLHISGSSVYPGEYVPLYEENDFNKVVKYLYKKKTNDFPVNINESANSYRIELAIPGVERENLFLKACGNVLSVSVIHNNDHAGEQNKFELHEFTFDGSFARHIILPGNADTIFISAEFKSGILHLCIPKSEHPVKWCNTKIAFY